MTDEPALATSAETELDDLLKRYQPVLSDIWQAMRLRLVDTGLEDSLNVLPRPELAKYSVQRDPFDSSKTLTGVWRDSHGSQIGEIQVRDNGSIYAELDVVRNHPVDARWFVEAVTAWGRSGDVKTELKLLPVV